MRLQLIVQRHSLPPVQVLWNVGVLRPPYADAGTSALVSQLLEQINEIIPLESEDWGLEDYAVEVRGFECLHFSELSQVLKEDDEVRIRPLQTSDLRFRKVSGRHQISADGKHLIDGIAFGRPYLRRPDRPAIRIPPRKRRRVTYDEDDDSDSLEVFHDRQLLLRRGTNHFDRSLDVDEEDDEDFSPNEDKENDLSTELQDIYNDALDDSAGDVFTERTTNLDGVEEPSGRLTRSQKAKKGLGLQGAAMLELVDENGRPYPGEYSNPLLDLFSKDEVPLSRHSSMNDKRIQEKLDRRGKSKTTIQVCQEEPERVSRRSSSASMKSVRFEDPNSNTPATIRGFDTGNHLNHKRFEPVIDIAIDPDESDKENSQPHFEAYVPGVSPSIISSSSSSSSSEHEYDDEETSSSGSSSADSSSESESEPERHPTTSSVLPVHSDRSSQTGSSSINSDPEAEKTTESSNGTGFAANKDSLNVAKPIWKNSEAGIQANEQQIRSSSVPYKGKNQTKNRNHRRRDSKKMNHLKRTGVLHQNATLSDFRRLKGNEHIVNTFSEELREEMQVDTDLEQRRDALLEAIICDGLEVSRDLGLESVPATANIEEASTMCHAATTEDSQKQVVNDQPSNMLEVEQSVDRNSAQDVALTDQVSLGSTKRRSKLDIASSRRLVFGSLGLPTPKNNEDEMKIQERLMKDVKRRKLSDSQIETEADLPFAIGVPGENEGWEEKIVLKAVECCYDGIELSTPPFPFVQRWDPQQQGGHEGLDGRNRRSKKRKRNSAQYYQQVPIHNLEDRKTNGNAVALGNEESPGDNIIPLEFEQQLQKQQDTTSRIENDEYELAINDQLNRETNASANASAENGTIEDFPMLPQDMSTCTPLTKGTSLRGAIVAFKQLDMSQETNWEPRVSDYRTALVDHLMENGILRMTLAQRDQPQVRKSYNQQTGERIYSKFEMPGFNDDESLDNGFVELSFAELIEPKLIRVASVELLGTEEQQSWGCGGDHLTEVMETESIESNIVHSDVPSPSLPYTSIATSKPDSGHEEVRNEINDLIKDAGWRSSIHSDIGQDRGFGDHLSPSDQAGHREQELVDPISPKFRGFSSSPPARRRSEERSEFLYTDGMMSGPVSSPQIEKVLEVAESLPCQRISRPELPLKEISSYEDEVLDVKEEENEHEHLAGNQPQPESGLPGTARQASSQQRRSSKAPNQSLSSDTGDLRHKPPTKEVTSTRDSDSDEFPLVEDIFSQMISSYEPSSVDVDGSTDMGSSSFDTSISKDEPTSDPEMLKSKPDGKENLSEKQILLKYGESDGEEDQTAPYASQVPLQSQIVDLTRSSDPADATDSDYVDYGTQLPSGPGWVQKKKASGRRFKSAVASNRRPRRTRSTSQRAFS